MSQVGSASGGGVQNASGVPVIVVSLLAPLVQSVIKAVLNAAAGVGIAVSYEDQSKLQAALIFIASLVVSLAWTWVERRVFTKKVVDLTNAKESKTVALETTIKPPAAVVGPVVALLICVGWFIVLTQLGACATNSQRHQGKELSLDGAPAGMNSLTVKDNTYTAVSRNPIGVVDGQNFSAAGENPMTVLQLTLADGQALHIASGSNGKVQAVSVEDLKTGVKATIEGIDWDNEKVNNSTLQAAVALYGTMAQLSEDEASVRIKQLELSGQITEATAGILRTLLGVP